MWRETGILASVILALNAFIYKSLSVRIIKVEDTCNEIAADKQNKEVWEITSKQIEKRLDRIDENFKEIYSRLDEQTLGLADIDKALSILSEKIKNLK